LKNFLLERNNSHKINKQTAAQDAAYRSTNTSGITMNQIEELKQQFPLPLLDEFASQLDMLGDDFEDDMLDKCAIHAIQNGQKNYDRNTMRNYIQDTFL